MSAGKTEKETKWLYEKQQYVTGILGLSVHPYHSEPRHATQESKKSYAN